MRILLLQLDGKIPNLALMRLSAHHRVVGNDVVFRQAPTVKSVERGLWDDGFDQVYASLIFERTRPVAKRLMEVFPGAVVGGTGWDLASTLEGVGVGENVRPDYSIYPKWQQSIGFTQRGCRLNCSFCVVPRKEGSVRETASINDVWRGDPNPRELILLDNDFFGQPHWRERIAEIRDGNFKVSFNQGINARMLSEEAAEAIASVNYRDDGMKAKRIYTAWDSAADEGPLFRGLNRLVKCGVKPDHIMVYMLIGYHADERESDWLLRRQRLFDFGARPYPMPYHRNHLTVGFQRWCQGGYHKRISWEDWKKAKCQPANLHTGRFALPTLDLFSDMEEGISSC